MMGRPAPAAYILLAVLSLLITACSGSVDNQNLRVDVVSSDDQGFSVNKMPLPPPSAYLRAATAQGLVTFDREGRVVPALASRWMVTDDGQTYVFRVQKALWNNGEKVDTGEVAEALNNRIKQLRGSVFGASLDNIIAVERMTGRVMQIRLAAPMPNLLEYLASPEMGVIHDSNGSGPLIAQLRSGAQILRRRSEDPQGKMQLSEARLILNKHPAADALARLKSEESDMATGGKFETLPMLTSAQLGGGEIDVGNRLGLFGLLLVNAGPFLSEAENREAIAMAIDRPRALTAFEDAEWKEQLSIVPEEITDRGNVARPDWSRLNMPERKARGRRIIARWKAENGKVRPLRIAMPAGAGSRILFAWIKADLSAIGLEANLVEPNAQADFRMIDRLSDATSAEWYLAQISCNATSICDAEADALLNDARDAVSTLERRRLLGEAEAAYQQKRNYIPIANPLRWTAYRAGLLGYTPNTRGWHYLQTLGSDPR